MSQRPAPLTGIRVLDLTRVLAGPWCTQNLADLGAEVIKIERPGAGDDTRAWGPPYLKDAAGNDTTEAAYYLSANRNKLSVALDIATPRGAELVRELAQQCDILVENFKVGGLRKYGLDYESVKAINPRLIYCSITGFGQTGPYASRPGYDFMIQGMGGLMSITGERDDLPGGGPQKAGVAVTDLMTGMYSTVGILAALHERNRSGLGQHIDMALLDCQVAMLANQNLNYMTSGKAPRRQRTPEPGALPGVRGQRRPPDRGGGQRQPVPQLLPRDRPARTGRRSALCHQSAAGACIAGKPWVLHNKNGITSNNGITRKSCNSGKPPYGECHAASTQTYAATWASRCAWRCWARPAWHPPSSPPC